MHWKCHIFCKRVRKEIEGMNPLVFWSAIPLNPIQSYCFLSHCPIHWLTSNSDSTEKCIDLEHRAGDIKFFSLSTNPMKIPKPTENWFHRCNCNDIYLLQICMFFSFAHDRCVCVCGNRSVLRWGRKRLTGQYGDWLPFNSVLQHLITATVTPRCFIL